MSSSPPPYSSATGDHGRPVDVSPGPSKKGGNEDLSAIQAEAHLYRRVRLLLVELYNVTLTKHITSPPLGLPAADPSLMSAEMKSLQRLLERVITYEQTVAASYIVNHCSDELKRNLSPDVYFTAPRSDLRLISASVLIGFSGYLLETDRAEAAQYVASIFGMAGLEALKKFKTSGQVCMRTFAPFRDPVSGLLTVREEVLTLVDRVENLLLK